MWLLSLLNEKQHEANIRYLLRPGKEYTIGRKDASIVFLDKSVSRAHAVIKVDALSTRSVFKDTPPKLLLSDKKSKYGTFINEKVFEYDLYLNDGDIIRFGSMHSIVRLRWEPVAVCLPSMRMADKTSVAERAAQLGILLKREWDKDCTHLYMKEIDDTAKFLLCLTLARPVISIKWFDAMLNMPEGNFTWPTGDYLPPIKHGYDIQPNDCEPNPKRATLLKDLEFLFFDSQLYQIYEPIVKAAGGRANLFSSRKTYSIDDLIAENKVIVAPTLRNNEDFSKVVGMLQERNYKWIEGQDIGTAIVKCTTSGICSQPRISQEYGISVSFPGIETQKQQQQQRSLSPLPVDDSPLSVGSPSVRPAGATLDNIFDNLLGDDDDDDDVLPAPVEPRQLAVDPAISVELEADFDSINEPFTTSLPHQSPDISTRPDPSAVADSPPRQLTEVTPDDTSHPINSAAVEEDQNVLASAAEGSSTPVQANDDVEAEQLVGRTLRKNTVTESLVKRTRLPSPDSHFVSRINTKRFKKGSLAENSQTNLHLVVMQHDGRGRDIAERRSPGHQEDEDDYNQTNEASEFADILIRVNRIQPGRRAQHT